MMYRHVPFAVLLATALGGVAWTLPQQGTVAAGDATFSHADGLMTVNQTSGRAIINWDSFNIGAGEGAVFNLPDASAISLNRVTGGTASMIDGRLNSNGNVYLLNPYGIVFGAGAAVDVGGLLATTAGLGDAAFMAGGPLVFAGGAGQVVNHGVLAADTVALAAPTVENHGSIEARQTDLAGAGAFTVDPVGDRLLTLAPDPAAFASRVVNSGVVHSNGGRITLAAQAADAAYASVVNTSGLVEANGVDTSGGRITLTSNGGITQVAGTVTANGATQGGTVDVLGGFVDVQSGARLAADGVHGGGALHVGGGYQGQGPLATAHTTRVAQGALLTANAVTDGHGGQVVTWSDNATRFNGTAQARGGANGGNGGLVEISGKRSLAFAGHADTLAANGQRGTLLFDPTDILITDGGPDADDAEPADGNVLEADGGAVTFNISEQVLEGLAAGTDIVLQASNNITVADLSDNTLALATTGNVTFTADSDSSGLGSFAMNTGDTITTAGAGLTITGAGVTLGGLNTSAAAGGAIAVTAGGGSGPVALNGNLTTQNGAITLDGTMNLYNDSILASDGGTIALLDAVAGSNDLTLNAGSGHVNLQQAVNADNLTVAGATADVAGTHTATGNMHLGGVDALTLTADTTLNAGGTLTLGGGNTVNGAYDLVLAGATVNQAATVGGSTPLTSLAATASGALTLADATTSGNQTYSGGTVTTGGTLTTTAGSLALTGPVTLGADTTLAATNNNITVNNTVNGAQALVVSAPSGAVNMVAALGGSTPLSSLNLTANTFTVVGAASSGNQTYSGAGTVRGTYTLAGGNLLFNNAVTLAGADTMLATSGGHATFAGTLNGSQNLTAATGSGQLRLQGAVGGSTPLLSVASSGDAAISAPVITTGNQNYNTLSLDNVLTSLAGTLATTGATTLLGTGTFTTVAGGGNINLGGDVTGAHTLVLVAGSGDLALAGIDVDTLTLTSADDVTLAGDITTVAALAFTNVDDIILAAASSLDAGSSNITFDTDNTLSGAYGLTLAGDTITHGRISGLASVESTAVTANVLAFNATTSGNQTYNGPTSLGANLTTTGSGDITLANATTLTADATLATAGGAVTAGGTVDGAHALTATTGAGDITFAAAVGGGTPLTDLALTTTGAVDTQAITLSGDAMLDADTVATHGTVAANNVTANATTSLQHQAINLAGDLVAAAPAIALNSTVAATNIDLTGTVTAANTLAASGNLTITGDNTLTNSLSAGGDLTLAGAMTLANNITLTSGGGSGDVLTLTGNVVGDYDLALVAGSGDINLTGDVDVDAFNLTSGDVLTYGGGTIESDSGLNLGGVNNIHLAGDTNLLGRDGTTRSSVSSGGNDIIATTGGVDLYVYGNVVTLQELGNNSGGQLQTLTIDASIAQLLGNIYTIGTQTITAQEGLAGFLLTGGGDIILNTTANLVGDIFIETVGGNIYINQPLNGAYAMNLNAGSGDAFISAALGNVVPLTNMTITAANINLTSPITTTGDQTYTGNTYLNTTLTIAEGDIVYNSPVNLGVNGAIDTSPNNGDITFNSTVDGPYNLTLRAGREGNIFFNDYAGATTRIGNITVESTRNITFARGLYVENYVQNRIDGLASFGSSPGLDATGTINVATSNNLDGTYRGRDIVMQADGLISGLVYATNSLSLASGRTLLGGSIRGVDGREGARLITLNTLTSGPHYFGGLALPIVDDFSPLPRLVAARFSTPSASGAPLPFGDDAVDALNPFAAFPQLLAAEAGVVAPARDDVEDIFSPPYITTF